MPGSARIVHSNVIQTAFHGKLSSSRDAERTTKIIGSFRMTSGHAADYFFISHATEDNPLSDWLALKLAALGYKVWYDRFDLLGGERFSRDITTAINGAFRLLAVVSKVSKEKDNPVKEWTAAINIGRERKTDFLIPLMVDHMSPTELPWQLSDITWVPFADNWATGLRQLLENLEKIDAPKTAADGSRIARNALTESNTISANPEVLHSNIIRINRVPKAIHRFKVSRKPSPPEDEWIEQNWPVFWVGREREQLLSFQMPLASFSETPFRVDWEGSVSWQDMETIAKIKTENIVSNLLKKSIEVKCFQKGLKRDDKGFLGMHRSTGKKVAGPLYFPIGPLGKEQGKVHPSEKEEISACQWAENTTWHEISLLPLPRVCCQTGPT